MPNGKTRDRAPGTVNNSVLQLAAAVNFSHKRKDTLFPAAFRPKRPEEVNRTPTYRASIPMLAKMFEYAMVPRREALLNFLRAGIVTLIRPEHSLLIDVAPAMGMWSPESGTLNLLPRGVDQTRKRRPIIPVARQAVPWLEFRARAACASGRHLINLGSHEGICGPSRRGSGRTQASASLYGTPCQSEARSARQAGARNVSGPPRREHSHRPLRAF